MFVIAQNASIAVPLRSIAFTGRILIGTLVMLTGPAIGLSSLL